MLALAASLGFAFQSTLVMAQVASEPDVPVQTKPKTAKQEAGPKVTPTDNVADELNRREAERATKAALRQRRPRGPPNEVRGRQASRSEVREA